MARVLREGDDLGARSRALLREARWLGPLACVEAALAAGLLLSAVFVHGAGSGRFAGAGLVAGFLSAAHAWRRTEAAREGGWLAAGSRGEQAMSNRLARSLGPEAVVVNDLLVRGRRGRVQIDHAVILPVGVFLIETKNWAGEIRGSPGQRRWVRCARPGERERLMGNPVLQSERQADAVRARLAVCGLDPSRVYPLVVFVSPSIRLDLSPPDDRVVLGADAALARMAVRPAGRPWGEGERAAACAALGVPS